MVQSPLVAVMLAPFGSLDAWLVATHMVTVSTSPSSTGGRNGVARWRWIHEFGGNGGRCQPSHGLDVFIR